MSSVAASASSAATGASLTEPTATETVAVLEVSVPSVTVYVKSAVPLKFAFGVKVTVPSPLSTAVPPVP